MLAAHFYWWLCPFLGDSLLLFLQFCFSPPEPCQAHLTSDIDIAIALKIVSSGVLDVEPASY